MRVSCLQRNNKMLIYTRIPAKYMLAGDNTVCG